MAPRQLQTNADAVKDIARRLVNKYLSRDLSDMINPNDFELAAAKKKINHLGSNINNAEDSISYHMAMGILYVAQGNFVKAKNEYGKIERLLPKFGDQFRNYNNILIGASDFEKAKKDLEEYFEKGGKNFAMLVNLFYCSRWDLDFSSFKYYYDTIQGKDVLSSSSREVLDFYYAYVSQWEDLKADLPLIGIDISLYSEFYSLLNSFYAKRVYKAIEVYFEIDDEEQYLIVDVCADISDNDALMLTSKFESYMVKYALANNKRQLLSKFSVFFKGKEFFSKEGYPDIYLRSDCLVV